MRGEYICGWTGLNRWFFCNQKFQASHMLRKYGSWSFVCNKNGSNPTTLHKVIQVFLNPVHFFSISSFLIWKFSVNLKVLKIQLRNQISPTLNHFQDIGAIKKKNCIFLKKRKVNEITYSTLFTHICAWLWGLNSQSWYELRWTRNKAQFTTDPNKTTLGRSDVAS